MSYTPKYWYVCQCICMQWATRFFIDPEGVLACCDKHAKTAKRMKQICEGYLVEITEDEYAVGRVMSD